MRRPIGKAQDDPLGGHSLQFTKGWHKLIERQMLKNLTAQGDVESVGLERKICHGRQHIGIQLGLNINDCDVYSDRSKRCGHHASAGTDLDDGCRLERQHCVNLVSVAEDAPPLEIPPIVMCASGDVC
jgi:hypothetical protein